jgi:signal transduction histidine kinase
MMMADLGAKDIYDPGIDQYVMIAGQFIAITLINIGFLRIFLDLREQKNVKIERNLAAAEAEASMLERHRIELQNLLTEREEIIRQLTLSNKTAGMGALVASLAHELNQPLCAIRLNAQLVERKLNMPELDVNGARKFLDSVIMDNRRAADIITKLRGMFENSDRDQGRVNLDDIIKDTLALVAPRAKEENVTLHAQLATGFSIQGDATQLQQVILNLLNNAFDALDALNTSNTINSLDRLNAEENLPKIISIRSELNDDRLLIYVEDNGIGIPDELQSSVFELFKTNKAQGMGVGLWLSKTVINAHRGDIRFTSTPGEGTLFEVSLPTH